MPALHRVAWGALGGVVLAGCGGGPGVDWGPTPESPPLPGPPAAEIKTHGRFVGTVTIDGVERFADGLLTQDGEFRLYVGVDGEFSGAIPQGRTEGGLQFAAALSVEDGDFVGGGFALGEGCVDPGNGRFCDAAVPADFSLRPAVRGTNATIEGEIRVAAPGGVETWTVEIDYWPNDYEIPATALTMAGGWTELQAEFAGGAEIVVSIHADGSLFFQSPATGCTGNGQLTAHGDGAFYVHDFELHVESCAAAYATLNGDYRGFATSGPSSYWGYDAAMRSWLVQEVAGEPTVAVTTWAPFIY